MPIRPENKKLYPKNWKQIRKDILQRANNRCEFCGVENYAEGYRDKDGNFIISEGVQQEADTIDGEKIIRIVLTVAHLDHDPQNNDYNNLRALCQRCHLRHDIEQHRQSWIRNKKLPLFEVLK